MMAKNKGKDQKSIEQIIWSAADKLRGAVEPSEYKHVVLSLIFLKYANDRFDEQRAKMIENNQSDFLELVPFYAKDNVFFIPEKARWGYIMENAKQNDIAIKIDTALHEVESKNEMLQGALPDNYYSRLHLDSGCLSSLVDLINGIDLQKEKDKDVFGRVYEYCLKEFALKEGKGKGEFYTPKSVVALLCELIQPYSGIVYDGACGSGGMFVQSIKFVDEHKGNKKNISVYGQEYTDTTRRLCKMNLAIRGISANLGDEAANTFLNDKHKDLKVDFALENPPFNQKGWRTSTQLTDDPRWNGYKIPPISNANYAWLLNTLSKLGTDGVGAVLLANGALSADSDEYQIRKQMILNDVIEAIIILPKNCFYTTDISVTCWILNRNKKERIEIRETGDVKYRDRSGKILFMDLRKMGHPYEKKYIELTEEDRNIITSKFKASREVNSSENYCDVPEFCYTATLEEIVEKDYSLVPSRYIEFINRDETIDYDKKMKELQVELTDLFIQEKQSRLKLKEVMENLGYGLNE